MIVSSATKSAGVVGRTIALIADYTSTPIELRSAANWS